MEQLEDRVEQLTDFIMKNCLWQFHSRKWDRERQNENILKITSQILCEETVEKETPEERCYYVDAAYLADSFQARYDWVNHLSKEELKVVMEKLKERIDFLTITGSLNKELTDPLY